MIRFGLLRFLIFACAVALFPPTQISSQGAGQDATPIEDVRAKVGPLPQGGYLLNTGWRITPAGKNIPLGTLPVSSAVPSSHGPVHPVRCGKWTC